MNPKLALIYLIKFGKNLKYLEKFAEFNTKVYITS